MLVSLDLRWLSDILFVQEGVREVYSRVTRPVELKPEHSTIRFLFRFGESEGWVLTLYYLHTTEVDGSDTINCVYLWCVD